MSTPWQNASEMPSDGRMHLPLALIPVLLLLAGMLLSRVDVCMVSSVVGCLRGEWRKAQIVLVITTAIAVVLLVFTALGELQPPQLPQCWWVPAGGLLFGFASARNQGCFLGSSLQLTRGDGRAWLTALGWILGFRLSGVVQPVEALQASPLRIATATTLLIVLTLWSLRMPLSPPLQRLRRGPIAPDQMTRSIWVASLLCGSLLALVDHDGWHWDPSSLAQALSQAPHWVASPRTVATSELFGTVLLLGMALEAWIRDRFHWRPASWCDLPRLGWGILMAMGSVLALGGNDSQLFRYLPGGSPHAWLALPAMMLGIWLSLISSRDC